MRFLSLYYFEIKVCLMSRLKSSVPHSMTIGRLVWNTLILAYHTPALTITSAECIDDPPLSLRISSCIQFKGIINTHGQHNTALILTDHSSWHRWNKTPLQHLYRTYKHGMRKHGTHTGYVRCSCINRHTAGLCSSSIFLCANPVHRSHIYCYVFMWL